MPRKIDVHCVNVRVVGHVCQWIPKEPKRGHGPRNTLYVKDLDAHHITTRVPVNHHLARYSLHTAFGTIDDHAAVTSFSAHNASFERGGPVPPPRLHHNRGRPGRHRRVGRGRARGEAWSHSTGPAQSGTFASVIWFAQRLPSVLHPRLTQPSHGELGTTTGRLTRYRAGSATPPRLRRPSLSRPPPSPAPGGHSPRPPMRWQQGHRRTRSLQLKGA